LWVVARPSTTVCFYGYGRIHTRVCSGLGVLKVTPGLSGGVAEKVSSVNSRGSLKKVEEGP